MQSIIAETQEISNTKLDDAIWDDPNLRDPDGEDAATGRIVEPSDLEPLMVSSIVTDAATLEFAAKYVDPKMFTQNGHQAIVALAIDYFETSGTVPAEPVLKALINDHVAKWKNATHVKSLVGECYYLAHTVGSTAYWIEQIGKRAQRATLLNAFKSVADGGDLSKAMEAVERARAIGSKKKKINLQCADDIEVQPPMEWQVAGHFPKNGTVTVFGPSGAGKSFYCIDMALSIACGVPFLGNEVIQGRVLYLCSEGSHGLRGRIIAWKHKQGITRTTNNVFSTVCHDLQSRSEMDELIQEATRIMGGVDVVFVDTLTRNFGDGDTDNNRDMKAYLAGVDYIRESTGAAVINVHHTGWADVKRERGAKCLRDYSDTSICVNEHSKDLIEISCKKQKDGQAFDSYMVRKTKLESAESLYLEFEDSALAVKNAEPNYGDPDSPAPPPIDPGVKAVLAAIPAISMVEQANDQNTTTNKAVAEAVGFGGTKVKDIVNELVAGGLVCRSQAARNKPARLWKISEYQVPTDDKDCLPETGP